MVRTQIQLTEKQATALRARAARERVSMAELVRRSVDYLIASDVSSSDEDRWRRVFDAAGSVHTGLTDLSENHDRYLTEAYTE